jgi:hypothetical protein
MYVKLCTDSGTTVGKYDDREAAHEPSVYHCSIFCIEAMQTYKAIAIHTIGAGLREVQDMSQFSQRVTA